jgi:hypothetical protein
MPIEANYKEYYAIHLDHYSTVWAGNTYNKILVTEFPDLNLVSTVTTYASSAKFVYPRIITNKCYVDGVAEGHITLYNNSTSTATTTNYTVTLSKTEDVPSTETTLGTYSKTISTGNTLTSKSYLTLPFYINIDKKPLNENEKLLLYIAHTSTGSMCICHANDSSNIDVKIRVPYAPEM